MEVVCLANFIENNYDNIKNHPNAVKDEIVEKFTLKQEDVSEFIDDVSNTNNLLELHQNIKGNISIPSLGTLAIGDNKVYPMCSSNSCKGIGYWNLPICPQCHTQIANLAKLKAYVEDNADNLFSSKLVISANTTGQIIIKDDDVIVTDRDLAEAKRDIQKYIP